MSSGVRVVMRAGVGALVAMWLGIAVGSPAWADSWHALTSNNAWYINSTGGSASTIDLATDTKDGQTVLPTNASGNQLAISPDGTTGFIAGSSNSCTGTANVVQEVDLSASPPSSGAQISLGSYQPVGLVVSPDGKTLYVDATCSSDTPVNAVIPVDLTQSPAMVESAKAVAVGNGPYNLAMSPDGSTVYAANQTDGTVSVIDVSGSSPTVVKTVTVGSWPMGMAVSPDGSTLYVANGHACTISEIDTASNTVSGTITLPQTGTPASCTLPGASGADAFYGDPAHLAISPDGSTLYAADPTSKTVVPIPTASGTPGAPIDFSSDDSGKFEPTGVAIPADGNRLLVSNGYGPSGCPCGDDVQAVSLPAGTLSGSPIGLSTSTPGLIDDIQVTPDQAPVANFTVTSAPPGQATSFDASSSTVQFGTIASYHWDFGDGSAATTSSPTTTHVYASVGTYTATVTETSSGGTSTADTTLSTGRTLLRLGSATAQTSRSAVITTGGAPSVSLGAQSLQFGQTLLGQSSAAQTETITNTGTGQLGISDVTLAGAAAGDYRIVSDSCAGATIQVAAGCGTTVAFSPTTTGSRTAQLTYTDNASGSPHTVQLSGTGIQPAASLSTAGLDFGQVGVGDTSVAQSVTVRNTGSAALGISSVTLAGSDSGDYSISLDGCGSQTIAPQASCTTEVTFTPGATNQRSAQLVFSDDAPGSPQVVALTGVGLKSVKLSGSVTFNGRSVSGAAVQACPTGGAGGCQATTSSASGTFSVGLVAPPGATYSLTAFPPSGLRAGEGVLTPITISSADFTGLQIVLPAPPSIASGVTFISPSFGTETSGTANPVLFWDEPNQIQLSRGFFPPNGTVVVTQIVLSGINAETGQPMTKVVNVGGTAAGNPVGAVVGDTPLSVTIPSVKPMHGQISAHVNYQLFPTGTFSPTGVAGTQVLYEVYPPPDTPGAQPTDPLPAYFTDIGEAGGISIGPGSISGADAQYFSIVPLSTYGVPAGTTDCSAGAANLSQWNRTTSVPPPGTSCGIAVQFTPPPDEANAHRIFYYATLDVEAQGGGAEGMMHVALIGCDKRVADEAEQVTGYNACGGDPEHEPEPPETEPPPPCPPPVGTTSSDCPPDPPLPLPFPYVDPSGKVFARTGHGPLVPLAGATVTLRRSHTRRGRFGSVHNGSDVMSPANRRNPDRTTMLGSFGWDVLPGFYQVTARHPGCHASGGGPLTKTKVLSVPPPAVGLRLVLVCPHLYRTRTHTTLHPRRLKHHELLLIAIVRGPHPEGLVQFTLGRRLLGSVPLNPRTGRATLTVRVAKTRGLRAHYEGDGHDLPSTG